MCYFGLYHEGLAGFDDVSVLSVINLMVTVKQKITLKVNKKPQNDILDARGCSSSKHNCFKLI